MAPQNGYSNGIWERILRWRGAGWVEDDPFNPPIGLDARWKELDRDTPKMLLSGA